MDLSSRHCLGLVYSPRSRRVNFLASAGRYRALQPNGLRLCPPPSAACTVKRRVESKVEYSVSSGLCFGVWSVPERASFLGAWPPPERAPAASSSSRWRSIRFPDFLFRPPYGRRCRRRVQHCLPCPKHSEYHR